MNGKMYMEFTMPEYDKKGIIGTVIDAAIVTIRQINREDQGIASDLSIKGKLCNMILDSCKRDRTMRYDFACRFGDALVTIKSNHADGVVWKSISVERDETAPRTSE